MIPGKKYTPEDIVAIVWRRKWLIVIPFVARREPGTFVYARTLPDRYRSETLILVVPQRVPEDYVQPRSPTRIEDRLQTIRQQILSRTRLEPIIVDLNLYPRRDGDGPDGGRRRADAPRHHRHRRARRLRSGSSYVSDAPVTAMRVTERLASLFIDENLRDRELLAQGTSQFLESQLEDARRRLVEQEKRLEAYRRAHAGELPSQLRVEPRRPSDSTQLQVQSLIDSVDRDRDQPGSCSSAASPTLTVAGVRRRTATVLDSAPTAAGAGGHDGAAARSRAGRAAAAASCGSSPSTRTSGAMKRLIATSRRRPRPRRCRRRCRPDAPASGRARRPRLARRAGCASCSRKPRACERRSPPERPKRSGFAA